MTADDLSAPLRRQPSRGHGIPVRVPQIITGVLALFLTIFVLWAVIGDDPFGGEPMAVVPANLNVAAKPRPSDIASSLPSPAAPAAPSPAADARQLPVENAARNSTTVTIIDGKTGAKQEVTVPAPTLTGAPPPAAAPTDQKFVEMTPHGPIPKIAADGTRPADAFARPVEPIPGKPDAPRIALIVAGLGVSSSASADAIAKLPGPVSLAFEPYSSDVAALAARARDNGHEVLLEVPMEPFDYPDNDPGPQTLLTSLAPQQNMDRLYWLMSRFQNYVGITNAMGARFTASEPSLTPVLREAARRGLIYVDDGSNPRSVAARIAGVNNLPFARADVVVDAVPTPSEIDRALGRLEMTARERGAAVGVASDLPVAIDHIVKWANTAEERALLLVPISAVAMKAKQARANGEITK